MLTLSDIERARALIGDRVLRTPMVQSDGAGLLKAELFQKTGSFKVRGMFNKLLTMPAKERDAGMISISAGNAAAALALAASGMGARATIVMPSHAVPSKIALTRACGGDVVLTDAPMMDTAREIQQEKGFTFVHPFDDVDLMAGHGTIGLEILEDVPDVSVVIVPVGGGGLIGGIAAAIKGAAPNVRVYGVEPEKADTMCRSLASGKVEHMQPSSIADGLNAPFAGEHTLAHAQRYVDAVVRVPDELILEALRLLVVRAKLAAEPAGAAGVAGLLSGAIPIGDDERVVCVVSGGNVDASLLKEIL